MRKHDLIGMHSKCVQYFIIALRMFHYYQNLDVYIQRMIKFVSWKKETNKKTHVSKLMSPTGLIFVDVYP